MRRVYLRHDPMTERYEFPKFAKEGVNALIISVKDMRPISMRHHVRLLIAFSVAIAAQMRPFINDKNLVALPRKRTGNYSTAKSGSDNAEGETHARLASGGGLPSIFRQSENYRAEPARAV
jgi:hypothetical protein